MMRQSDRRRQPLSRRQFSARALAAGAVGALGVGVGLGAPAVAQPAAEREPGFPMPGWNRRS